MGNEETFEGITAEDLEIFNKLKAKIKNGREQMKAKAQEVFAPALNVLDMDNVFKTIAISGMNKISTTIKLEDGRKLQVVLTDKSVAESSD